MNDIICQCIYTLYAYVFVYIILYISAIVIICRYYVDCIRVMCAHSCGNFRLYAFSLGNSNLLVNMLVCDYIDLFSY